MAVMDHARLKEIFIERPRERGLAGGIYKGSVTRVLPGMQAAFVDIGLEKAAFLPAADFYPVGEEDAQFDFNPPTGEPPPTDGQPLPADSRPPVLPPIEERLRKGNEIIVQIAKEPIATKGARVTSNISIPGRFLVYLPFNSHIGVSRRIVSEEERTRLREAVESVRLAQGGIILRTACEGVSKREIQYDLRVLRKIWARIAKKAESVSAPAHLHDDLDVILRTMRDVVSTDVTRVLVDNRRDYERILDFVATVMPKWRPRVELYQHGEPIFERYGIEGQITKALDRKVWLKSGGYLIIDHTEALTTIDVNTGRFVGHDNQEETVLRTNLEATQLIVDQLRLRNIGGLIVIDFIDMEDTEHRKAVLAALADALKSDKARVKLLGISELGLVEMTRQRTRESLLQRLCEPCPTCGGRGRVKAVATTAYEILRRVRREAAVNAPLRQIVVTTHPHVATFLREHEAGALHDLQRELHLDVVLKESGTLATGQYEMTSVTASAAAGSK